MLIFFRSYLSLNRLNILNAIISVFVACEIIGTLFYFFEFSNIFFKFDVKYWSFLKKSTHQVQTQHNDTQTNVTHGRTEAPTQAPNQRKTQGQTQSPTQARDRKSHDIQCFLLAK